MVPAALAGAFVLVLGSAAPAGATPRHRVSRCAPGHARTIVSNARVQVYAAMEPGGGSTNVYGCAYGSSHVYELGLAPYRCLSAAGCGATEQEVLAGDLVAYERFSETRSLTSWELIVRNLRTGRVLHKVGTGLPLDGVETVGVGPVTAIVLERDGAVAWIANDEARSTGIETSRVPVYDVEALDAGGPRRLLAAGFDVDPASLALAADASNIGPNRHRVRANEVYWTQGGHAASAALN
ncbi:MAG TPA: hypothetical protein VLJ80_02050 [Solirubrobacteraceae bacterium]|nr:hypothetical protein [Solirubrobacteraceae bacterium]